MEAISKGSYGTPMTIIGVPARTADPRRATSCPRCYAPAGYPCKDGTARAPRLHRERYDPAAAATLDRKRKAAKAAKKKAKPKPKPGSLAAENARLRQIQDRMRARGVTP
jgi:hypothetical protein